MHVINKIIEKFEISFGLKKYNKDNKNIEQDNTSFIMNDDEKIKMFDYTDEDFIYETSLGLEKLDIAKQFKNDSEFNIYKRILQVKHFIDSKNRLEEISFKDLENLFTKNKSIQEINDNTRKNKLNFLLKFIHVKIDDLNKLSDNKLSLVIYNT